MLAGLEFDCDLRCRQCAARVGPRHSPSYMIMYDTSSNATMYEGVCRQECVGLCIKGLIRGPFI